MADGLRLSCIGFCGADDSVDPRLLAAISQVRCHPARVPHAASPRADSTARAFSRRPGIACPSALSWRVATRVPSGIPGWNGACCSAMTRRGSPASRPPSGSTTSLLSIGRPLCRCARAHVCARMRLRVLFLRCLCRVQHNLYVLLVTNLYV